MLSDGLVKGAKGAADFAKEELDAPVTVRSIYHLVEIQRLTPIRPSGNPKGTAYFQKSQIREIFSPARASA